MPFVLLGAIKGMPKWPGVATVYEEEEGLRKKLSVDDEG